MPDISNIETVISPVFDVPRPQTVISNLVTVGSATTATPPKTKFNSGFN